MDHELFWKEVVFLALLGIFSTFFYFGVEEYPLYWAFVILALGFYFITRSEERGNKEIHDKEVAEYFHHASSHFLVSALFFLASYFILYYTGASFVLVTLSIALVLFSVGFMEMLFERFEK